MARIKRRVVTHCSLLQRRTPAGPPSSISRKPTTEPKESLTQLSKQEDEFVRRPSVRLFIPDSLKSILVDDWEKVTKEQKLAQVPSPVPVNQFLSEYYTFEADNRRPGSADADILEEVIAGVREYFNKSLGRILLYRFERQQFYEIHKQIEAGHGEGAGKTLCDMYGCEHLLRLFGKFDFSFSFLCPLIDLRSVYAGPHRAHEHGSAVREPLEGGAGKDDAVDGEACRRVSLYGVPARRAGLP
jgi:hypothetical protein